MIGQTQIVGRSVDSLDRLVTVGRSGERVSLVTLTADPSTAIVDVDPLERRAKRALGQFEPEEQQVLLAWEPGTTWQGPPPRLGCRRRSPSECGARRKRVAQEAARRTDALRMTAARAGEVPADPRATQHHLRP